MSSDFPELVERTRQATDNVCEKAKLVLRSFLPGVEAVQRDNAHFSPRLMLLMVSRTGEQLLPPDRQRLSEILQHVEAFQPQLLTWMTVVRDGRVTAHGSSDTQECLRALDLMTKHLADLDLLLAKAVASKDHLAT